MTGYIGFKTLLVALESGHRVRAVVRNDHSIAELQTKSPLVAHCHGHGQIDFVVIPDFLDRGMWTKALGDITAIIHLASPLAKEVQLGSLNSLNLQMEPQYLISPYSAMTMRLESLNRRFPW